MNTTVVLRQKRESAAGGAASIRQPFLYPEGRFERVVDSEDVVWSCVRTRPRWEKKSARWLMEQKQGLFLPVFPHETTSGNKCRVSQLPLFPGFVFVEGEVTKKDFIQTGSVAYVLHPRSDREGAQLHRELRGIWCGLTRGAYVAPVQNLARGKFCRIVSGPLQGAEARFERMGRSGQLILQVEMMGGGIALEVAASDVDVGS